MLGRGGAQKRAKSQNEKGLRPPEKSVTWSVADKANEGVRKEELTGSSQRGRDANHLRREGVCTPTRPPQKRWTGEKQRDAALTRGELPRNHKGTSRATLPGSRGTPRQKRKGPAWEPQLGRDCRPSAVAKREQCWYCISHFQKQKNMVRTCHPGGMHFPGCGCRA